MTALALYDVYVLLKEKEKLIKSRPGNKIRRKSHQLYYIRNTDNTYQNLASFVVNTTFFSNHVINEKMLAFMLKKELGPLPTRNSRLK
jgi:hypothetical protein